MVNVARFTLLHAYIRAKLGECPDPLSIDSPESLGKLRPLNNLQLDDGKRQTRVLVGTQRGVPVDGTYLWKELNTRIPSKAYHKSTSIICWLIDDKDKSIPD